MPRSTPLCRRRPRRHRHDQAVALLEVILALSLFVAAAAVILSSLSASLNATRELELSAQADDIAATLLSELGLGQKAISDAGPTQLEPPLAEWSWQIVTSPAPSGAVALPLVQVELVVRHTPSGYVRRLTQFMVEPDTTAAAPTTAPAGGL
jgi:type II secretory pathway pseudopilin PulG